jgi:hypothetical protein
VSPNGYNNGVWLLLISCAPANTGGSNVDLFHPEDPVLQAAEGACNSIDGLWTFRIQTRGWTGGARLYIARDSSSVEQHSLHSVEAAADGSWDCLIEELEVEEDWTLAQSGSSSQWLCSDEPFLSFMVQVDNPQGDAVADCAAWGSQPELWSEVDGLAPCTEFLQQEGQTTDTGDISWRGECDG